MKKPALKAIVASLLLLLLLFLSVSGAMLYFGKTGVILGIARSAIRAAHFKMAVSMCVLTALHLLLNRRLYMSGLKSLLKGEGKAEKLGE